MFANYWEKKIILSLKPRNLLFVPMLMFLSNVSISSEKI